MEQTLVSLAENFSMAVALSWALLELVKWVVRKVKKNQVFDFPAEFYTMIIPGLNLVSALVLAFAGFEGYALPVDGATWLRGLVVVLMQSVFQVLMHNQVVIPNKNYRKELKDNS
jgi:hypothetical protein